VRLAPGQEGVDEAGGAEADQGAFYPVRRLNYSKPGGDCLPVWSYVLRVGFGRADSGVSFASECI
jgi:hypothetical protein